MLQKKISDLKVGEEAVISYFLHDYIAQHIIPLGLIPNQKIIVEHIAPMGSPIALNINGDILAIRKDIASEVVVSQ
ncbi:MAG: ferrous iron transport protein A [Bacteroidetes bacterium]|nr:ferrous iron transport protein A [Bacteroidota bacterium]